MKLTVLGSGTVIPYPKHGNSGYFLQSENHSILIDGGSGALRKIADFGLNYRDIDIITYTHLHPDHCFDFIPLMFSFKHDSLLNRPKSVQIIAPKGFQIYFDQLMEIYGEWVIDDDIQFQIREISEVHIKLNNLIIQSFHTYHTDNSVGYLFVEVEGGKLLYSGDTDYFPEIIKYSKDMDILLLECSFPDDMKRKGHLTPSECGRIASESDVKTLILTHLYPEVLESEIIPRVKKYYSGEVIVACDGLEIEI